MTRRNGFLEVSEMWVVISLHHYKVFTVDCRITSYNRITIAS